MEIETLVLQGTQVPRDADLINKVVSQPGVGRASIVSTNRELMTEARPVIASLVTEMLEATMTACPNDSCGAKAAEFEQDIIAAAQVYSMGVICTRACTDCPLKIRDRL